MAVDLKKVYKKFYLPSDKPEIVEVPKANYIAVRGKGDPNEKDGAYQQALSVLYAVAYTLKMSCKTDHKIEGFYEYVVPPLEGFWWQDSGERERTLPEGDCREEEDHGQAVDYRREEKDHAQTVDYRAKDQFNWISVLRLPEFVTKADVQWAVETASRKKKIDCSRVEFYPVEEGLCVQVMHRGAFDDEPVTVARMDAYLQEHGYENDFNAERLHHEIYLSDVNRTAPEKWKTVIRHPVRKKGADITP